MKDFPLYVGLAMEYEYEMPRSACLLFRSFKRRSSSELLNGCLAAWANEALRPVYLPFLRARPAILHPSFA